MRDEVQGDLVMSGRGDRRAPVWLLREHTSVDNVGLTRSITVANWYNVDTLTSSPSQINFLIFSALWSVISIVYLEVLPKFAPRGKYITPTNVSRTSYLEREALY